MIFITCTPLLHDFRYFSLSWVDVEGLRKWDAYTDRIATMFERTHFEHAPWTVIRGDDKRRARVNAIRSVLARLDYPDKSGQSCGCSFVMTGGALWKGDTEGWFGACQITSASPM